MIKVVLTTHERQVMQLISRKHIEVCHATAQILLGVIQYTNWNERINKDGEISFKTFMLEIMNTGIFGMPTPSLTNNNHAFTKCAATLLFLEGHNEIKFMSMKYEEIKPQKFVNILLTHAMHSDLN